MRSTYEREHRVSSLLSGKLDMSMQLSATPAANTLAATEAFEAPAAGT